MTSKTLSELARYVGGKVIGDGSVVIHKIAAIDEAIPGEITFLTHRRYQQFLSQCRASAVIVGPGVVSDVETGSRLNYIETPNPYVAFAKVLQLFSPAPQFNRTVSPESHIEISAILGESVTIFPNAFVGPRVRIGTGTVIFPGVFLGEEVQVGAQCVLHPNVVVREGCRLGDRVILHAGSGDQRVKIPQTGIVVVEDDVEIGANTTVDRATLGRTVISRGVKIDNLVQIAHNVIIGEHSIIAAQAGIAGSTRIGKNVTLAGQVGVVNHVQIGDGAMIGPQSGIPKSVPAGAILSGGIAAAPHHEWLKVMTLLPQLPMLWRTVRSLEKRVAQILKGGEKELDSDAGR